MVIKDLSQSKEELEKLQKESLAQERPDQKTIVSVSSKIRKRLHNLPNPENPPLGYDEHKAFDRIFPYINIPTLHPQNHGDTVIFNDTNSPANRLYLGDNLQVLRTLKPESIDLIYIDPPFFSGRNYNVIWGDSNEVRTFEDIWEGGITSYLIWLNARLWEMRRVLKKTGSIYVHCDWHASHYIKCEMDKIFGYGGNRKLPGFKNQIVWMKQNEGGEASTYPRSYEVIFFYTKGGNYYFKHPLQPYSQKLIKILKKDEKGWYYLRGARTGRREIADWEKESKVGLKTYVDLDNGGTKANDLWIDEKISGYPTGIEKIGYPTQKPEKLLERIIKASSNEGDVVADFFCGGGTTQAVAQKLKRKFIGCDSSRVAVSVTLDRLVKIGEEMSGVKSNISTKEKAFQLGLQAYGIMEKVPNIELWYSGVYPIEKFKYLDQEFFIKFVLTAYGASRNTAEGIIHGYKPPAQQEPIYIGPADPNQPINAQEIKEFFNEVKTKVEPNKMIRAKIIAWKFPRQIIDYLKVLQRYSEKNNLLIELEAIPLDSKNFRRRILERLPGVDEAELYLRFSKPPVISDIRIKKLDGLEYQFEAVDVLSMNEDGWLVNCQWDFDYQSEHFTADKDYILSREKKKDKKRGEIFEALLTAKHKFEKSSEYVVACKVQDNLAGETIFSKKFIIESQQ